MNETIIIIPARLAATRLSNKPLIDICGKSMIERVIEQARKANISPVYVATPDQEIYNYVTNTGTNAVYTGYHHQSGTDRIAEALQIIDTEKKYNYIINLQGDLPTIDPDGISKLNQLIRSTDADIATLATKISDIGLINSPSSVKIAICEKTNDALYFSRSPIPFNADIYFHHIGIYGYKRDSLEQFINLPQSSLEKIEKLEQLRALENSMKIKIQLVEETPISIDTESDLKKVTAYINNL